MGIEKTTSYVTVDKILKSFVKGRNNLVVVTIPGMGATFQIKLWMKNNKNKCIYITEDKQEIGSKNIIDIDLGDVNNLAVIDSYLKNADLETNFLVVINDPSLLTKTEYINSYLGKHVYSETFLKALNKTDTKLLVDYYGGNSAKTDIDRIYKLSGGIGRLVKYLSVNKEKTDISAVLEDVKMIQIMDRLVEVVSKTSPEWLINMGITDKNGHFISYLLDYYLSRQKKKIDIVVESDLSIVEDGEKGNKLARSERDILLEQIKRDGFIGRDKVAEIKWGKAEFSDFSDQALNKTMRRINDKLRRYRIKTIWKVGYQIEPKNG